MSPYHLGPVLIVAPEQGFASIAAALEGAGFTREARAKTMGAPLIAGEPELAGWSWHGQKPIVSYTFNPVVRLRVLEVATVPPLLRAAIAAGLTLVAEREVEPLLGSRDVRERLRGLFIAREAERLELIPAAQKLLGDPERVVAKAAGEAVAALQGLSEARAAAQARLAAIAGLVRTLLPHLCQPEVVRGLEPKEKDCEALFDASLAGELAKANAIAWQELPLTDPGACDGELEITAALAGLLRSPNELGQQFPLGYREIAGWMNPSRTWVTWLVRGGPSAGIRYDGLAWVEDHWVWMPKPFLILGPLIEGRLMPPGG